MSPDPGLSDGMDEEVLSVPRRARWLPALLACVLATLVTVVLLTRPSSKPAATPGSTTALSPSSAATSRTPVTGPVAPVLVTALHHRLLGVDAGWELFGRGSGVVVRIEFARGRVTTTTVPLLDSTGPVSFVLGKHLALVRPLDFVPAYEIPDGRPAREFSGSVGDVQAGPIFPGPDGDSIWAPTGDSPAAVFRLVPLDGAGPGSLLQVPRGTSSVAGIPDGAGGIAFAGLGAAYDSTTAGLRKVTTGSVIAVGPTRWLVRNCHGQETCPLSVVDPRSGTGRVVARPIGNVDVVPGVVSPDASAAAAIALSPSPVLVYFDLRTGAEDALPLTANASGDPRQSLVWSPDSHWLFALDASGDLQVIDARTRRVTEFGSIGTRLPSLSQIAIR